MPMPPMMAGEKPMMDEESDSNEPDQGEASEKTSVFIPKDALGGKKCEPGEKVSFTVKDVDPETGEVEAVFAGYGESEDRPKRGGMAEAIDSMPE